MERKSDGRKLGSHTTSSHNKLRKRSWVSRPHGPHLTGKSPAQHNQGGWQRVKSERGRTDCRDGGELFWLIYFNVCRGWGAECQCGGVRWRWEMGAAMCKLSHKVGQHVKQRSTGRTRFVEQSTSCFRPAAPVCVRDATEELWVGKKCLTWGTLQCAYSNKSVKVVEVLQFL